MEQFATELLGLAIPYQPAIEIGAIICLVVLVGYLLDRNRKIKRKLLHTQRGNKMDRRELERFEKVHIADALEEVLFNAEFSGRFSSERANFWRRRFANILDNEELLSKHTKTLKNLIKDRLSRKSAAVSIPGPLPGENQNVVVPFPGNTKKLGSAFLSLKKAGAA